MLNTCQHIGDGVITGKKELANQLKNCTVCS